MNPLVERKGYKIESTLAKKKKVKDKKTKVIEHVQIIDDDAPIPWDTTTTTTTTITTTKTAIEPDPMINDDIGSVDDAPVVVGIIDERPSHVQEKERFKDPKRWHTKAFEEVPDTIGPQPKPTKSSHRKENSSDDSDPDIDRRRPKKNNVPDLSPPRRRTQHGDDDPDPPRRRNLSPPRRKHDDSSPPRKRAQVDDDSSPPRRRDTSPRRRKHDDFSPPRRRPQTADDSSPPRRKHKHDDDPSPPRRRETSPSSRKQHQRHDDSRRRDTSLPSHRHSRSESSTDRRQPKEEPSSPSTTRRSKQESSPPPSQPAKSERRRLAEHKEQVAERYAQWGRGLAQVQQTKNAVKDYLEQAEKPLARYRDDKDLDTMFKGIERDGDPMLKYLSNKPSDACDQTNNSNRTPAKPRYKGPDPQKNRFDIWPGYRWDGVDRSNGFEKKLFESLANRHAKAQEAYLWSVEDM